MIQVLVKVRVEDFPHFIGVFSTRAALLRKKHGCRRARLQLRSRGSVRTSAAFCCIGR